MIAQNSVAGEGVESNQNVCLRLAEVEAEQQLYLHRK